MQKSVRFCTTFLCIIAQIITDTIPVFARMLLGCGHKARTGIIVALVKEGALVGVAIAIQFHTLTLLIAHADICQGAAHAIA